jgi:hypothetical protein
MGGTAALFTPPNKSLKPTRLAAESLMVSYLPGCARVKVVWADSPSRLEDGSQSWGSSPVVRSQSRRAA